MGRHSFKKGHSQPNWTPQNKKASPPPKGRKEAFIDPNFKASLKDLSH